MNLRRIPSRPWFYPLLLLLTALLAYGWQLGRLGFYWDGWMLLFAGTHLPSLPQLWNFYYIDRPFSIWTILLTAPILGLDPLRWQLLDLLLRGLSVLAFVWTLQTTWPGRKAAARWCGLLLIVFPGFSQQAVTAYNQHWFAALLFTGSLGLMVWAVRYLQGWKLRLALWLAALLALAQVLTVEYFAGLELLRPILIWIVLTGADPCAPAPARLRRLLAAWLPFALALLVFAAWRFGYYPGTVTDVNAPSLLLGLQTGPGAAIRQLLQNTGRDTLFNLLFAWSNTLSVETINARAVFSYVLAFLAAVAAFFGQRMLLSTPSAVNAAEPAPGSGLRSFLLAGLLALLLGGLPVWVTDRQATVGPWSDRFTLATMYGAVMLVVGLSGWFITRPGRQALFLAALVGLSAGHQVRTLENYAERWEMQRDYFWQLAWRAPDLKPGTALLAPKVPFTLVAEDSLGYALNLIYAHPLAANQVEHWFFSAPRHRYGDIVDFQPGRRISFAPRSLQFESSTDHSLLVTVLPGSCLRVLDRRNALESELMESESILIPISNPGQIELHPANPVTPPAAIFGPEPEHNWCYYYEKAELALQQGIPAEAAHLGDEAAARGLRTKAGREWLPFVEGYALSGQWEKAWQAARTAGSLQALMQPHWCAVFQRLDAVTPPSPGKAETLADARSGLDCPAP